MPARPIPSGKASCRITPSDDGIGDWSEAIAYLLQTGNTPDFDTVGDNMVPVQENMAKLTPEDREAIAAYLKSLPPLPGCRGGGRARGRGRAIDLGVCSSRCSRRREMMIECRHLA